MRFHVLTLFTLFMSSFAQAQQLPFSALDVVSKSDLRFVSSATLYSCSDAAAIEKRFVHEKSVLPNGGSGAFFEGKEQWKGSFVFVNSRTNMLTICHNGESFSSSMLFPKREATGHDGTTYEMFVSSFADLNKDGKPEFILDERVCNDRCGTIFSHIVSIERNRLVKVASLRANNVYFVRDKGDDLIKIEHVCYEDKCDGAPGPGFFQLAGLSASNEIKFVPYQMIRTLYKSLLPDLGDSKDKSREAKIQRLINRAYYGESATKLLTEARQVGNWEGCSTEDIILEILQLPKRKQK